MLSAPKHSALTADSQAFVLLHGQTNSTSSEPLSPAEAAPAPLKQLGTPSADVDIAAFPSKPTMKACLNPPAHLTTTGLEVFRNSSRGDKIRDTQHWVAGLTLGAESPGRRSPAEEVATIVVYPHPPHITHHTHNPSHRDLHGTHCCDIENNFLSRHLAADAVGFKADAIAQASTYAINRLRSCLGSSINGGGTHEPSYYAATASGEGPGSGSGTSSSSSVAVVASSGTCFRTRPSSAATTASLVEPMEASTGSGLSVDAIRTSSTVPTAWASSPADAAPTTAVHVSGSAKGSAVAAYAAAKGSGGGDSVSRGGSWNTSGGGPTVDDDEDDDDHEEENDVDMCEGAPLLSTYVAAMPSAGVAPLNEDIRIASKRQRSMSETFGSAPCSSTRVSSQAYPQPHSHPQVYPQTHPQAHPLYPHGTYPGPPEAPYAVTTATVTSTTGPSWSATSGLVSAGSNTPVLFSATPPRRVNHHQPQLLPSAHNPHHSHHPQHLQQQIHQQQQQQQSRRRSLESYRLPLVTVAGGCNIGVVGGNCAASNSTPVANTPASNTASNSPALSDRERERERERGVLYKIVPTPSLGRDFPRITDVSDVSDKFSDCSGEDADNGLCGFSPNLRLPPLHLSFTLHTRGVRASGDGDLGPRPKQPGHSFFTDSRDEFGGWQRPQQQSPLAHASCGDGSCSRGLPSWHRVTPSFLQSRPGPPTNDGFGIGGGGSCGDNTDAAPQVRMGSFTNSSFRTPAAVAAAAAAGLLAMSTGATATVGSGLGGEGPCHSLPLAPLRGGATLPPHFLGDVSPGEHLSPADAKPVLSLLIPETSASSSSFGCAPCTCTLGSASPLEAVAAAAAFSVGSPVTSVSSVNPATTATATATAASGAAQSAKPQVLWLQKPTPMSATPPPSSPLLHSTSFPRSPTAAMAIVAAAVAAPPRQHLQPQQQHVPTTILTPPLQLPPALQQPQMQQLPSSEIKSSPGTISEEVALLTPTRPSDAPAAATAAAVVAVATARGGRSVGDSLAAEIALAAPPRTVVRRFQPAPPPLPPATRSRRGMLLTVAEAPITAATVSTTASATTGLR